MGFANLIGGELAPREYWVLLENVQQASQTLAKLLDLDDEQVLKYAYQACDSFMSGGTECIDAAFETGICKHLCNLLRHRTDFVETKVLCAVARITSESDDQIQKLLELDVLSALKELMSVSCFAISNILAGRFDLVRTTIKAGIIPMLMNVVHHSGEDPAAKRVALEAICNATSCQQGEDLVKSVLGPEQLEGLVVLTKGCPRSRSLRSRSPRSRSLTQETAEIRHV